MERRFLVIGAVSGAVAVGLGAFGAHALESRLTVDALATFNTASRYHFYHTLALLAVAAAAGRWPDAPRLVTAGWLMLAGTIVFSGSLYLLAVTGIRWLGAITPVGGLLLIAGWLTVAWHAYMTDKSATPR